MRLSWISAIFVLAAGVFFASAPTARASLMLEVSQANFDFGGGLHEMIFVDNNVGIAPPAPADPDNDADSEVTGIDFNPLVGSLQLGLTQNTPVVVGGITVTGSVHTSNSPGTPLAGGIAQLASQAFVIQNNTAASVTQKVIVGDTGYMFPTGGLSSWVFQISGNITGGVTIRNRAWDDSSNKQFGGADGHTDGTAQLLFDDTETSTFNKTLTGTSFVGPGPYAKTIEFDITLAPGASLTLRNDQLQNTGVPEPATLVGAGFAAVALAVFGLRRRASKVA